MAGTVTSRIKSPAIPELKIAVLGVGAIGALLASEWAACGFPPTLLLQDDAKLQRYRQSGGVVIESGGSTQRWQLPAAIASDRGPNWDVLMVCTKAWAAAPAIASAAARIGETTTIVLLCNGMGVEGTVRAALGATRTLLLGSTTQGAYRQSEFSVCHAGYGQTTLGGQTQAPAWLSGAQAQGLSWLWEPAINGVLWRKLLINCAINPLAALYRCRNGELLENPTYRAALEALIAELESFAAQRDTALSRSLAADIHRVVESTAQNRCSMLQDLEAGRPTEKDYILGYLLRHASEAGVVMPLSTELLERLMAVENGAQGDQ